MAGQPIEVRSDGINLDLDICRKYLTPKELMVLMHVCEKIGHDMREKGKYNLEEYELLMELRSITSRRMFSGQTNEVRGVDVETEMEEMESFNRGAKKRFKTLIFASVLAFLLLVAAFTLNIMSIWYPSIYQYHDWIVWSIPCVTVGYMIFMKEWQIKGGWKYLGRPLKTVWWLALIFNMFLLVKHSLNLMGW